MSALTLFPCLWRIASTDWKICRLSFRRVNSNGCIPIKSLSCCSTLLDHLMSKHTSTHSCAESLLSGAFRKDSKSQALHVSSNSYDLKHSGILSSLGMIIYVKNAGSDGITIAWRFKHLQLSSSHFSCRLTPTPPSIKRLRFWERGLALHRRVPVLKRWDFHQNSDEWAHLLTLTLRLRVQHLIFYRRLCHAISEHPMWISAPCVQQQDSHQTPILTLTSFWNWRTWSGVFPILRKKPSSNKDASTSLLHQLVTIFVTSSRQCRR